MTELQAPAAIRAIIYPLRILDPAAIGAVEDRHDIPCRISRWWSGHWLHAISLCRSVASRRIGSSLRQCFRQRTATRSPCWLLRLMPGRPLFIRSVRFRRGLLVPVGGLGANLLFLALRRDCKIPRDHLKVQEQANAQRNACYEHHCRAHHGPYPSRDRPGEPPDEGVNEDHRAGEEGKRCERRQFHGSSPSTGSIGGAL